MSNNPQKNATKIEMSNTQIREIVDKYWWAEEQISGSNILPLATNTSNNQQVLSVVTCLLLQVIFI